MPSKIAAMAHTPRLATATGASAALLAVLLLATGGVPASGQPGAVAAPSDALVPGALVWRTTDGTVARFRVREQLARLDFPNDAVGETDQVEGTVTLTPDGRIDGASSGFTIAAATLETDSGRRDNYLRRNTLATEDYPEIRFQPRELRGLDAAAIVSGEGATGSGEFEIVGDLTIREVTRQVVWSAEAEWTPDAIRGMARTQFTFDDFQLEVPSVGSVLSINNDIRLELDFHLVPAGE